MSKLAERNRMAAAEAMKARHGRRARPLPPVDRESVRHFIYRLHGEDGAVVYVGRSCRVAERIKAHVSDRKPWLPLVRRVTMFGPMTWDEAVAAERQEIARLQPPGNIALTARDHRPTVAWRSLLLVNGGDMCPTCGAARG